MPNGYEGIAALVSVIIQSARLDMLATMRAIQEPKDAEEGDKISEVLDAVVMRGPRGPRRPKHLCLDKGYDYPHVAPAIRLRGIRPLIRRRGEQPLIGKVRGKARRWVVERTNSWHNRFRGLLVRWERRGAHYLALVQFACGLIAFQQAT